jgi:hypothetical protein
LIDGGVTKAVQSEVVRPMVHGSIPERSSISRIPDSIPSSLVTTQFSSWRAETNNAGN